VDVICRQLIVLSIFSLALAGYFLRAYEQPNWFIAILCATVSVISLVCVVRRVICVKRGC
jgi:hypothetical protein